MFHDGPSFGGSEMDAMGMSTEKKIQLKMQKLERKPIRNFDFDSESPWPKPTYIKMLGQ